MAKRNKCKSCWWWKNLPPAAPDDVREEGKCYMHSIDCHSVYTSPSEYCPDHIDRKEEDKKMTLEEYLRKS